MHIRLLAVGDRQPAWVDEAFDGYTKRFPREWAFQLDVIPAARRGKSDKSSRARDLEGQQILDKIKSNELFVLLDERGRQFTSKALSERFTAWQNDGRDLCFVIGGPDGISPDCRERADATWSLSDLTLPHGLARVLFAEQLYRAWSLQSGHPYHRE
ncbi:MAG: 23S rRNA (pseudouridine(1915)-N(3))-methyltransferase RlmH [Woeseiaceae bacterium]|nr:23S rRNA (pseudouridine(1915)-N(3))-methyltransferase RlmH [Woeseiaceae bacterium]